MANFLPIEKKRQIFSLLCEGMGVRPITRHVGISTNTVAEFQNKYCTIIDFLNKKYLTELDMEEIEADELKMFVYKKTNIRWVYVALDRKSRMVVHFHIGNRDAVDTKIFLQGLSKKLSEQAQMASDCWHSYISAVAKTPNGRVDGSIAHIHMLRAHSVNLKREITNRVENQNGNIRQHVARLGRKSRCFSKSEESLRQHLTLYFFYYNFIKKHKAVKTTPSVAAGIANKPFTFEALLEFDLLFCEKLKTDKPEKYGSINKPVRYAVDVEMMKVLFDEKVKQDRVNKIINKMRVA